MASPTSLRRLLKTRIGFAPSLLLLGSLPLMASCGEEAPRGFSAESEQELVQLMHGVRPGDTVRYRQVGVLVPAAGEGVHVEAVLADGSVVELQVKTAGDGRVALVQHPEPLEALEEHSGPSALGACSDDRYSLLGYRWTTVYHWYFNAETTPGELTAAGAEQAIRESTGNITGGRNDCGLTDAINASHQYEGRTTVGADVTSNGACGARDGRNVTGFGDLPSGTLAVTCTWYDSTGRAVESDVRINKVDYNWTTDANSASCSNRFGLEAVMTHERGHTFGLGHVASGSLLTMRPGVGACDGSAGTLGLGDVRGLRQRY